MSKRIEGAPPGWQSSPSGPGWKMFELHMPACNEIVDAHYTVKDIESLAKGGNNSMPPVLDADEPLWWAAKEGHHGDPPSRLSWLGLTWNASKVRTAQILYDHAHELGRYYASRGEGQDWIRFPELIYVCRATGQVVIECGT